MVTRYFVSLSVPAHWQITAFAGCTIVAFGGSMAMLRSARATGIAGDTAVAEATIGAERNDIVITTIITRLIDLPRTPFAITPLRKRTVPTALDIRQEN